MRRGEIFPAPCIWANSGFLEAPLVKLPRTLLARSFLLMVILIVLSFAASVAIFRHVEQEPRTRQTAQLVVSVVNLTRAAVLSAAPEWRSALLSELAESEGLLVQMAEPGDALVALPDRPPILQEMAEKVRDSLGGNTRFAAQRNGVEALWVSFFIGGEEFWVALPRERIEHPASEVLLIWGGLVLALALLGAYFIARQVAHPLKRLAQAAQQVGQGATPQTLPERGAKEIAAVSRAFNRPLLLKRALSNLLDNAVKYGGGEITVQLRQDGNRVALAVADRGAGIPAAQREAAKRPFVRLESARSNATGSGLGLAIVERAARLHGGELQLEDHAGGGLVARLVLPAGMVG